MKFGYDRTHSTEGGMQNAKGKSGSASLRDSVGRFSKTLGAGRLGRPAFAVCLLPFAFGFAGCTLIETRPDPSRFYVLDSPTPAAADDIKKAAPAAWPLALAVARVQTPSYLDQPQLVSRSGGARVTFSEFNRWLEPMDKGATRVFANALAARLGAGRVAMEPTLDTYRDGVLVQANLLRFDGELGGDVVLTARYRVSSVHDGETFVTGEITLHEKCGSSDYPAYAGALGRLIDAFSVEVAESIRTGITTGAGGLPVKAGNATK